MFDAFKTRLARHKMSKMQSGKPRRIKACGLTGASTIGIIYDATTEADFEAVRKLLFELKNRVPYVKALGFVDNETLSDFHIQPLDFSFFCRKDLDMLGIPKNEAIAEFCNTNFDILFCLDMGDKIPLSYTKMQTNAGFRVGYYSETNSNTLDMMVSLDEENSSIEELIKQIIHYLEDIKYE